MSTMEDELSVCAFEFNNINNNKFSQKHVTVALDSPRKALSTVCMENISALKSSDSKVCGLTRVTRRLGCYSLAVMVNKIVFYSPSLHWG